MNYQMTQVKAIFVLMALIVISSCAGQKTTNKTTTGPWEEAKTKTLTQLRFLSRINIIQEDSRGGLWLVSKDEGAAYFDGQQFTHFTDLVGEWAVRAVFEGPNDETWFGIENGVLRYDGKGYTPVYPQEESQLITESFSASEADYAELWKREGEKFWFSAWSQNGVYRYDGESLIHLTLPTPEGYPDFDSNGYHPDHGYDRYAVYYIYHDPQGIMWFGTPQGGLIRYDGKTVRCVNEGYVKGTIRAILKDQKGRLWFGNNPDGIYQYNGKELTNFSMKRGLMEDYNFNGALSMAEDGEGDIWFATFDNGLWRYNSRADWNEDAGIVAGGIGMPVYGKNHGLDTKYISVVMEDSQGKIWVGTGNGGIYTFNGVGFDEFTGVGKEK